MSTKRSRGRHAGECRWSEIVVRAVRDKASSECSECSRSRSLQSSRTGELGRKTTQQQTRMRRGHDLVEVKAAGGIDRRVRASDLDGPGHGYGYGWV